MRGLACSPGLQDHAAGPELALEARSPETRKSPHLNPASTLQEEQEGPALRDSVTGPSLAAPEAARLGGWEPVRSVPPGSAWEVRHPRAQPGPHPEPLRGITQHPLQASPRGWGSSEAEGGRGRRAERAASIAHSEPACPPLHLSVWGSGATDRVPQGEATASLGQDSLR